MSNDTPMGNPVTEAQRSIDPVRYANAQAASHGFGAGKVLASRLIESWEPEQADRQASLVLDNLELAQAYAERQPMPFEDYVSGLRADPDLAETLTSERLATLETAFVTGFDIGFRAFLVETLAQLRERAQTLVDTE